MHRLNGTEECKATYKRFAMKKENHINHHIDQTILPYRVVSFCFKFTSEVTPANMILVLDTNDNFQ